MSESAYRSGWRNKLSLGGERSRTATGGLDEPLVAVRPYHEDIDGDPRRCFIRLKGPQQPSLQLKGSPQLT